MAIRLSLLGAAALAGVMLAGCSNMEKKLGRGINNTIEPIRLADMRRNVEQGALARPGEVNYFTGAVRGFNQTLARTGLGLFEIITFPIPPYEPLFENTITPLPRHPDSDPQRLWADPLFATDPDIGFSGGEIAPWLPANKFYVHD
jgi:putative exosortase-associated protein (TIGR04073 family)